MADGAAPSGGPPDVTAFVQGLLGQMQARFNKLSDNIISKIDDMGTRIDDLERGLAEIHDQTTAVADEGLGEGAAPADGK